jgi:hypothetical protein
METFNFLISNQKDYLVKMINNLSYLNGFKMFSDHAFKTIIQELKNIKDEIDKQIDIVISKTVHNNTFNYYIKQNNIINELLIKYSNHIASDNINDLFDLFIGDNWKDLFDTYNCEKLDFMNKFIRPISIWDSDYHKEQIEYIKIHVLKFYCQTNDLPKNLDCSYDKMKKLSDISNIINKIGDFKSKIIIEQSKLANWPYYTLAETCKFTKPMGLIIIPYLAYGIPLELYTPYLIWFSANAMPILSKPF